jgi:type IV secretion system protein VirD4
MNPRGQGVDDDLVNLGLVLIAAVGVLAAILRLAGSVAAFVSGAAQPTGGWEAGFRVLSRPDDPASALGADGLAAWVYWLVLILMVAGVVAAALVLWRRIGSMRHKTTHDPRRLSGVATGRDVRAAASHKALLSRGSTSSDAVPRARRSGHRSRTRSS